MGAGRQENYRPLARFPSPASGLPPRQLTRPFFKKKPTAPARGSRAHCAAAPCAPRPARAGEQAGGTFGSPTIAFALSPAAPPPRRTSRRPPERIFHNSSFCPSISLARKCDLARAVGKRKIKIKKKRKDPIALNPLERSRLRARYETEASGLPFLPGGSTSPRFRALRASPESHSAVRNPQSTFTHAPPPHPPRPRSARRRRFRPAPEPARPRRRHTSRRVSPHQRGGAAHVCLAQPAAPRP